MKYLGSITDDKDLTTKKYVDDADAAKQDTLVSGTNIKTINNQSLLGSGNISISGGTGSKNIWYATCPTSASTTKKVVTTDTGDFSLTTGNMLRVVFTNANSASAPTLEVDSQTATAVRIVTGTSGAQYHWQAGEVADFVYNGTYFMMVGRATATTTYYGPTKLSSSTSSTSTTLAATASAVKSAYDLANGKQNALAVTQEASTSTNLASNGITAPTISLSKSGYTPIGVVGVDATVSSGANVSQLNIMRYKITATNDGLYFTARNLASSTMTGLVVTFYVLWQKD